jgi:hypothetical protein
VLFGSILDESCVLWQESCGGEVGSCLYYNNYTMAMYMFTLTASAKLAATIFALLASRSYRSRSAVVLPMDSETAEHKTTEMNGMVIVDDSDMDIE